MLHNDFEAFFRLTAEGFQSEICTQGGNHCLLTPCVPSSQRIDIQVNLSKIRSHALLAKPPVCMPFSWHIPQALLCKIALLHAFPLHIHQDFFRMIALAHAFPLTRASSSRASSSLCSAVDSCRGLMYDFLLHIHQTFSDLQSRLVNSSQVLHPSGSFSARRSPSVRSRGRRMKNKENQDSKLTR